MMGCKPGETKDLVFEADPWTAQQSRNFPESQSQACSSTDEPWVLGSLSSIEGLTPTQITKLPDLEAHVIRARDRLEKANLAYEQDRVRNRKHPDPSLWKAFWDADQYYNKVSAALTWVRPEKRPDFAKRDNGKYVTHFPGPRLNV